MTRVKTLKVEHDYQHRTHRKKRRVHMDDLIEESDIIII